MFKRLTSYTTLIHTNRLMHSHSRVHSYPKFYDTNNTKCNPENKSSIITPILFDVSLRDGIQGANPLDYPTNKKLELIQSIYETHAPKKLEIGSFVSPKVLPIMSDTAKIFETMPSSIKNTTDIYALVPNKVGLLNAINCGFTNFSFITSVSNAFQVKNTGKNLVYKKTELQEMTRHITDVFGDKAKTKLYVSCVTECPVIGVIDSDFILHEIVSSYGMRNEYDEICISDTMGTLRSREFEYIVNGLIRFGVPSSHISVHLHINSENSTEAKQILFVCFEQRITRFDVSVISEGGCSVTMNPNQLKSNMTYEFFNKTFKDWSSGV